MHGKNVLTNEKSIREFCDLKAPIIMFDKDDNYKVARLEQVSLGFVFPRCHRRCIEVN